MSDHDETELAIARELAMLLGHTWASFGPDPMPGPNTILIARDLLRGLRDKGFVVLPDETDHYVTIDADGWFIEHSITCRVLGIIGTCEFNEAVRRSYRDVPESPFAFGRFRILSINEDGIVVVESAPKA